MSYELHEIESLRARMLLITRSLTDQHYRVSAAAIGDVAISGDDTAEIGEQSYELTETFSSWRPFAGAGYGFHLARTYRSRRYGADLQIHVSASRRAETTDLDTIHDLYLELREELSAKIAAIISREGEE